MVMQSGNNELIKSMLCHLFIRYQAGVWNSFDTSVAIAYLIQSKFQHDKSYIELLQNLANHPAVWCYKPEVCCQFLQLKPEVAQKLLKVYGSIEDDRFKKKYLKLLTKEAKALQEL